MIHTYTAGETRTEWGLRLDCTLNGCDPPHADNGRVFSFEVEIPRGYDGGYWVNSHKCRLVSRTVTYSTWVSVWDGPFCVDTNERAVNGTCPTHGGDNCLKMRGTKP